MKDLGQVFLLTPVFPLMGTVIGHIFGRQTGQDIHPNPPPPPPPGGGGTGEGGGGRRGDNGKDEAILTRTGTGTDAQLETASGSRSAD
jgi:hypothetical protein